MGPAALASSLAISSSSCEQGRGKATLTPLLPYSYALGLPSAHHLWPVPTFGRVTENHLFTLALQGKDVPLRRVVRGLVTLALAGQAVVLPLQQILPHGASLFLAVSQEPLMGSSGKTHVLVIYPTCICCLHQGKGQREAGHLTSPRQGWRALMVCQHQPHRLHPRTVVD